MAKNISNKLKGVTVNGNYVGGDSVTVHYHGHKAGGDDVKGKGRDKTVFLSYNWHDGGTADKIDKHLSRVPGISVKRDVRDIGAWKSIRDFMKSIRQQDYAVLIINDSYLKSKNCMFEVTGQSKVRSANKQVDFFCFKGNLPAGNYFSYG